MIPNDVIQKILDHDIVSIIEGEGVELKKKGTNYMCCCPFHGEKTPSLSVSPVKNIWKCFGCGKGGTAITFVQEHSNLRYYEALKYLAKKLNIDYTEKELTDEDRAKQFERSQLIEINKVACDYFRESYKNSKSAQKYALKRWKEGDIEDFSIGYAGADTNNSLLNYCLKKGYKAEILLLAGLTSINDVNGSKYDFFRNRLMFPIFSRSGNIIGFSGRYVGTKEGPPKYINTKETPLYDKSSALYGIHQAQRVAHTKGIINLVEGNADVIRMHQRGITNTVAPCGTALTDNQIYMIKNIVKTVVLIGDMDDAGRKAVLTNGLKLLQAGLNVYVMILPNPGKSKDPDDYFKLESADYDECFARHKIEYIAMVCDDKMVNANSETEKALVIKEVAEMLAYVPEETVANMLIDRFSKEYKFAKIWRQEYNKAKGQVERVSNQSREVDTQQMIKEYGFYTKNNCFYGVGANNAEQRWCNFILEPIIHIKDEKNARRIFQMTNFKGEECIIKLTQSELVSFTDFKTRTETCGNFIWEKGPGELTVLKRLLYNNIPSATEIKQLGWQKRHNFFAWGNGGLENGTFVKTNEYGIFQIRDEFFYLPGCAKDTQEDTQGYQQHRKVVYAITNDISWNDYATQLITVFGDNAMIALCFLFASLFKDIVVGTTTGFPMLNVFGPKGTGKSELGHSLSSFFKIKNVAPNIMNSTNAALAEAVAEISNGVVHLDEYKNDIPIEKRETLKGLWDSTGRTRMAGSGYKQRETTAVDCGVVISGQEMPTADIALFSRLIFLTFSKIEFSLEEKKNFADLKIIEGRGLTHLTAEVLGLRNKFQGSFRVNWDNAITDMNNAIQDTIEDRTLKNWCTVLAAFKCIEGSFELPFTYNDVLETAAVMCKSQNNKTKENNELSGFWDIVDTLVSSAKMFTQVDYKIKSGVKEIKIKEGIPVIPPANKRYLYISFARISSLYYKEAKECGKGIPKETLKYYLEKSPEFVGTTGAERFKLLASATGFVQEDKYSKGKVTTAMVFDYDAIEKNYGIHIDITGYIDDEPEHIVDIEEEDPQEKIF